jgi:REP element-mobilizing transposase RayT
VCFVNEDDMAFYMYCLNDYTEKHNVVIHAWVLMTSHIHLLATLWEKNSIGKMMQDVGRLYVLYLNKHTSERAHCGKDALNLHDREEWSYRKISQCLNKSSILTYTGKKWFSSSVISVLKRKHEKNLMNKHIRNQHFPSKVSKFEVNYYIFD